MNIDPIGKSFMDAIDASQAGKDRAPIACFPTFYRDPLYLNLNYRQKLEVYRCAKRYRFEMSSKGYEFTEPYNDFIARIVEELEI